MLANTGLPQQHDKLVIFDDDPYFGALLSAAARRFNFQPSYFASLFEMGPFAKLKDYDFAIIDVYMGSIRGDELAQYIDMFCEQIPVLLVSGQPMLQHEAVERWPKSIRGFVSKGDGPFKILETARSILQRDRLLKRLATSNAPGLNAVEQAMPTGTV